jgi:arsenite methyltransferase
LWHRRATLRARRVGSNGTAYGLDLTDEMLELARANAAKANARNVEFLKGTIEDIPRRRNCRCRDLQLRHHLSTEKPAVFAESFRVLKPGGRVGVTDVVAETTSPLRTAPTRQLRRLHRRRTFHRRVPRRLADAGFTDIDISPTHQVADGMYSAIIRTTKPAPV